MVATSVLRLPLRLRLLLRLKYTYLDVEASFFSLSALEAVNTNK